MFQQHRNSIWFISWLYYLVVSIDCSTWSLLWLIYLPLHCGLHIVLYLEPVFIHSNYMSKIVATYFSYADWAKLFVGLLLVINLF